MLTLNKNIEQEESTVNSIKNHFNLITMLKEPIIL